MNTKMIKIQKASMYPKASAMMQLLDTKADPGVLPIKIVPEKKVSGKIEFFAEEAKKENGIGFLAKGQDEIIEIIELILEGKATYELFLVSYSNQSPITFEAELKYEKCEKEQIKVDTSVFDSICEHIVQSDICSKEDLERNIRVMKEHRFPDELIRQVLLKYRKYDRPTRVPKTIYIDPDTNAKTSLLALCAINIVIGSPLILEGDKSVGKNMCAETLAMIFNMPFDMSKFCQLVVLDTKTIQISGNNGRKSMSGISKTAKIVLWDGK